MFQDELSDDEIAVADDPISINSNLNRFWEAVAKGDRDIAVAAAAAIRAPHVVEEVPSSFSFGEGEQDRGSVARVTASVKSLLFVEPSTPEGVTGGWNKDQKVKMVELSELLCLATTSTNKADSLLDFKACTLPRAGISEADGGAPIGQQCSKGVHRDGVKTKRHRLELDDPEGTFAIEAPVSRSSVTQKSCFSRPMFKLSEFPRGLRQQGRHNLLLQIEAFPRTLRCLIKGYPGEHAMLQMSVSVPSPRKFKTPERSQEGGGREEVQQPSGVASLLRLPGRKPSLDGGDASSDDPWDMPTQPKFSWEIPVDELDDAPSIGGDTLGGASAVSTLSLSAQLSDALRRLNKLSGTLASLSTDIKDKDKSLARVINDIRREVRKHQFDIEKLENEASSAGGLFSGLAPAGPPSLSTRDRNIIADEVAARFDMSGYAKKSDIPPPPPPPPVGTSGFGGFDMSKYVTHQELAALNYIDNSSLNTTLTSNYVSQVDLAARDFASNTELKTAVDKIARDMALKIPSMLESRLRDLEMDVLKPGGAFKRMEDEFKKLSSQKEGSGVSAGTYTFKDITAVETWAQNLGGVEMALYFQDARAQLGTLNQILKTSGQIVREEADAMKAAFASALDAKYQTAFDIPFPESIFRESKAEKDQAHGGIVFVPAMATADIFDGTTINSTRDAMKLSLQQNRDHVQAAIDQRFPPDQRNHVMANSIASYILRQGYFQSTGFVDSIMPFYKLMTEAGLSNSEAWAKCLTYAKAVFKRIFDVRKLSLIKTLGGMIYGMLKSTTLLEGYAVLGWIRHPDVSSALVLASLQKEGRAVNDNMKKLKGDLTQVGTNTADIAKLVKELKQLKIKNPTWNT